MFIREGTLFFIARYLKHVKCIQYQQLIPRLPPCSTRIYSSCLHCMVLELVINMINPVLIAWQCVCAYQACS